jgi:predicted nuclease with TOPRIM domain
MNKNMNKKGIIEMDVIMSYITDAKEKVKETMKYWHTVLDELDRRAMEYSELLNALKAVEEEDKKRKDNVESMMKLNLIEDKYLIRPSTLYLMETAPTSLFYYHQLYGS